MRFLIFSSVFLCTFLCGVTTGAAEIVTSTSAAQLPMEHRIQASVAPGSDQLKVLFNIRLYTVVLLSENFGVYSSAQLGSVHTEVFAGAQWRPLAVP